MCLGQRGAFRGIAPGGAQCAQAILAMPNSFAANARAAACGVLYTRIQ